MQFLCRLHNAFVLDDSERLVPGDQMFCVSLDIHYQVMILTGHSR